jgi:hypothetical protein
MNLNLRCATLSAMLLLSPLTGATQVERTVAKVLPRDIAAARQRLEQNAGDVQKALAKLGAPLPEPDQALLRASASMPDQEALGAMQSVLDKYALVTVGLDDEAWLTITPASPDPATRPLTRYRWETYLVKVTSDARTTSPIAVRSEQALSTMSARNQEAATTCVEQPRDWARWFMVRMVDGPEITNMLSGKEVEYFVIQLCSLDAGVRAADLTFYLAGGQVSQGHYASSFLVFKPKDAR